jgi:hypothetical protein
MKLVPVMLLTATMTPATRKSNADLYEREIERLVDLAKRIGDPALRFELMRAASSFRKLGDVLSSAAPNGPK